MPPTSIRTLALALSFPFFSVCPPGVPKVICAICLVARGLGKSTREQRARTATRLPGGSLDISAVPPSLSCSHTQISISREMKAEIEKYSGLPHCEVSVC